MSKPQMVDLSGLDAEQILGDFEDLLQSPQVAEGKWITEVEENAAHVINSQPLNNDQVFLTSALNSCGSGLFAVAQALKVKSHHSCIVPVNTFPATMLAFEQAGFHCDMADCGKDDPSMTLESLEEAYARNPQATVVVLTHVGGCLAKDYEQIAHFCAYNGLMLVEDCAHVWGVPGAGLLGDAAVFSFYPTKAIPAGEGGVVATKWVWMDDYVRQFRNYGKVWNPALGHFEYRGYGLNLRMSEWQAVIVARQIERTDEIIYKRQKFVKRLAGIFPDLIGLADRPNNGYKFITKVNVEAKVQCGKVYADADQLMAALHDQSCNIAYPNAFYWARNHACLPVYEQGTERWTDAELEHYYLTGEAPE